MARQLKTGWINIGTSGNTVDGRVIDKQWIIDAAETYNPKVYQALIWPYHERYHVPGGKVLALKYENATEKELEGELHLFAIISPVEWFIRANAGGNLVFPSMELKKNFMKKGKFYLTGLGAVNEPGSAGTEAFNFGAEHEPDLVFTSQTPINVANEVVKEKSFFERFVFGDSETTPSDDEKPEEETMNEEQRKEFKEEVLDGVTEIVKKFAAKPEEEKTGEESGSDTQQETVSVEKFNALNNELEDTKSSLSDLTQKFEELMKKPGDSTTNFSEEEAGDDSEHRVIV